MATLSLRLPDDIDARLERESQSTDRAKSEIVRDAIVEFLTRQERQRFLDAIARAARSGGGDESLAIAEEALPLDNEALAIAESPSVQESAASYGRRRPRKR